MPRGIPPERSSDLGWSQEGLASGWRVQDLCLLASLPRASHDACDA